MTTKVAMLTPGTGTFFCGPCLRDHMLVRGLREKGMDAIIIPLYLPHVTEGDVKKTDDIFFGGINAYLQQRYKIFKYAPAWLDKLFNSKWALSIAAKMAGMTKAKDLGVMTVGSLDMENSGQQKELNKLIAWLKTDFNPDIILLSNTLLAGFAKSIKAEFNIPVVSTMHGEDSFLDGLPTPYNHQAWQRLQECCTHLDKLISVSEYYSDIMKSRLNLTDDKVQVIYNGIDLNGFEPSPFEQRPQVLGFLANIIPGKGVDTLIDAFIILKKEPKYKDLKLHLMGSLTPFNKNYKVEVESKLSAAGVLGDTIIKTNVSREEKIEGLKQFSVFSVPAFYGECFGLYLLEAAAMGLPVVQPKHAAFPEVLELLENGLLYEPDTNNDPSALAEKISQVLDDEVLRKKLGEQGRKNVLARFTFDRMADDVATLIKGLIK